MKFINVIEENESGEFVITIDKKPQEYRNIFFYKGVPVRSIKFVEVVSWENRTS